MARKPTGKLLGFIRQLTGGPERPSVKSPLDTDSQQSISNSERDTVVRRIMQTTQPLSQRTGLNAYAKYMAPMTRKIAAQKLDNHAIEVLAPEVKAAQTIVIPSIISPTDLRDGDISLQSTSKLVDQAVNDRITTVLDHHFNTHLKLSRKLPDWIHEALYGAGSKPLLVLPITELDILMNDPDAVLGQSTSSAATERLETERKLDSLEAASIFGIADAAQLSINKKDKKPRLVAETLKPAVESAVSDHIADLDLKDPSKPYNLAGLFKHDTSKAMQEFINDAVENLGIVDNPDILKADRVRKGAKTAELKKKIVTYYKAKTLITVNPEVKPSAGDPVVYELPPESVIPIFTPGTPTDHIGYFIAIDEFGNPIHLTGDGNFTDLASNHQRVNPTSLYKSFGLDANYHFHGTNVKREQAALMVNIYQTIVEAHLKGRLKETGLDNIYIGATENVYRCMFARYLSLRKTRLLFVPRDLLTYFCFKHNDDGTGRSKIEDIKFILSLKITVLICRMMASMNSAINRKKININFTEQMGDPIQYIELLKKEAIDKGIMNFTYDPTEITRTLAQRSLTVSAKGIPGAENFEISQEPNEIRSIRPDDSLLDDLNNMMILALDVPPSALNLLSENEFSRSVATNNLFFSRRIMAYQKVVCEKVARHVQVYSHMSETVKTRIMDILKAGDDMKHPTNPPTDPGTVDDKTISNDDLLSDIIKNIIAVLPAPDVAPNKTEFEELDAMINSLTTALEGIFDNDLGSVDDNPIILARALVKSDIVREYMRKIGVSRDVNVPDFDADFLKRLIGFKQQIVNMSQGLKDTVKKTTPPVDTTDGTQPSDDPTATGGSGF